MSYSATTIARIIDRLNQTHFLPAIQRPYVWEPEQVIALFDSLMKGYPISSFLFWDLKPENHENWDIYKFIENFRYGQVRNEIVGAPGKDVTLVLDGQQRLTSLLIALKGSYTIKIKHKRWDNPDAWVRQRLYIDLLKDPNQEIDTDDDASGISYGFIFSNEKNSAIDARLFRVGKILDFDNEDNFHKFKDDFLDKLPGATTKEQERVARRTLEQIYRIIWKNETISFYTETNQSYDRVLDIFIRANDGGTKLSKSDLLLSMISSKWDGVSARDEIYSFVEKLNNDLMRKNDIDKDLIMRSCLVLSDLEHKYKVANFTNKNLYLIQKNWVGIRAAVEATINLINRFGVDRDNMTSANALLPIAYYLYKVSRGPFDGSTSFEVANAKRIRVWFIGALLNNVFGGTSDQTIGVSRDIIREALLTSDDFPYQALVDGLAKRRGRISNFDENNIDGLFDIRYSNRTMFLALSLLYDSQDWGVSVFHIDHIIPKSAMSRRSLMATNIPESRIEKILEAGDRLGNLQLLLGRENLEKNNRPFEEWIRTRDSAFLTKHLIPANEGLWDVQFLPEFVKEREKLIRQRLARGDYLVSNSRAEVAVPAGE